MTIIQAITAADGLRNNMISESIKIALLSELDGKIYYSIIDPQAKPGDFSGYNAETPSDTELLVPYPYDSLYVAYLEQEILKINSETVKYNNARIVFNEKYNEYVNWHMRTHSRATPNIKFPIRRY